MAGRSLFRRMGLRMVLILGLFAAVAIGIAFAMGAFAFRPAVPTGPYAIGTVTKEWTDASRADPLPPQPGPPRRLVVQIWYPADAPGTKPLPYVEAPADLRAEVRRIAGNKAGLLFLTLSGATSNAFADLPLSQSQPRYPLLVFLHGAGGFRQMNSFQVEELASHGYIVAAIDQPGAASLVRFGDGTRVPGLVAGDLHALIRPSYLVAPPDQTPPERDTIIPLLAGDAGFVLDRIADLEADDPTGRFTGRIDLDRAGLFGVSLGGIVAAEACLNDPRWRACLMLDAPMPVAVADRGLRQPAMWLTRDAASMRAERELTGGWPEDEIAAHVGSMQAAFMQSDRAWFVELPDVVHLSFTDVAAFSPLPYWLGLLGGTAPRSAHRMINAFTLGFFDAALRARSETLDAALLAHPTAAVRSHNTPD
jgi:pimeloyl-ACP methyl ester carboxylesterase